MKRRFKTSLVSTALAYQQHQRENRERAPNEEVDFFNSGIVLNAVRQSSITIRNFYDDKLQRSVYRLPPDELVPLTGAVCVFAADFALISWVTLVIAGCLV
jgi:hypothetical protein